MPRCRTPIAERRFGPYHFLGDCGRIGECDMPQPTRRDFLLVSATVIPAVGLAASLWPFLDQMNPDAAARSLATTEVDLSPIPPAQAITVMWRGKAVFVRHRTSAEIETARAVQLGDLRDPYARNPALAEDAPATDENRTLPGHENWLILVGVCTHAGCIPIGNRTTELRGDYGGWRCPCHYSQYDTSGRVRRGPAPRNLLVPPYRFITDSRIIIG